MEHNRFLRRVASALLLAGGVSMMLLSTSVRGGLVAFGLGLLLELIGRSLERRGPP